MTPLPVVPGSMLARPAWVPPVPPRGPLCTAPGCERLSAHQHHAVSRSAQRTHIGDVYDWVEINGELVLVLVDLCAQCHDKLESGWGGCKSRLRWTGGWAWYDRATNDDTLSDKAGIWWTDSDSESTWILRGFCRGVYRLESDGD